MTPDENVFCGNWIVPSYQYDNHWTRISRENMFYLWKIAIFFVDPELRPDLEALAVHWLCR